MISRQRQVTIGMVLAGMAAFSVPADSDPGSPEEEITREFSESVAILAGDGMQGRGLMTEGIHRAADWIEQQLRRYGLRPAFGHEYRQAFDVKIGVERLEGDGIEGVSREDWTPLGASSSGEFSGELAFAGYGIQAPAVGYSEMEGMDLRGKVVLMLRYEPQDKDEASPFAGRKPSRWSALRYKVLQARERGAVAVVFTTGPLQDEGKDRLPVLKNDGPESPAGLPVLQVKTSQAQRWLRQAGVDLARFQDEVDRDLIPRSVDSTGVRVSGNVLVKATYTTAQNIAGMIPGKGSLGGECVVIGAHYDHLGYGGDRSMRPNVTEIHNGADDNASGVVTSLLSGRKLLSDLAGVDDHRTVVIALFSGEEMGLAGSSYFVEHPPLPIEEVVAMLNLDMVGRLEGRDLVVLGSESAPEWTATIDRASGAAGGLGTSSHGDGYGPSDQTSFYAEKIPVLHLFTGAHEAYHTPDDKPGTLDPAGAIRVARFTTALAQELARDVTRPTYARSSSAPTMEGDSRGYGAYLGTVPDYRAMEATEGGVLLADVRTEGPADMAGIQGGDRIVGMAGTRIENLHDMTYALQDNKPGETISVIVERDGSKVELLATLGDRASMSKPAPVKDQAEETPSAPEAASPPSPHGTGAASTEEEEGVAAYYETRPGPDFVPGAGRPFTNRHPEERHLTDIRQLTFGGENAEAYFDPGGRRLIFQATRQEGGCDQQFVMDLETGKTEMVSSGKGRTTCGYFDWPEADRIVFSSTEGGGESCPPQPDYSQGYVWALYDSYDLYEAQPDGSSPRRLTQAPGYDAEATWCHRGGKLVFTSVRDGDLELYQMDEAGDVQRLTRTPGYDGGAFYSPDCSEIVWRASRPQGAELEEYYRLLGEGLIRPNALEIYLMDADGENPRQLTSNGAANFCPTFTADGSRIIFASNTGSPGGREFDLWLVDKEGGEPEKITYSPGFDGFPQFSPDGRWLVWASNRANPESRETNIFIARWVD